MLLVLSACSLLTKEPTVEPEGVRWQGIVSLEANGVWLHPCGEGQRRIMLRLHTQQDADLRSLITQKTPHIFVDARGHMSAAKDMQGNEGILTVTQVYRLKQATANSCFLAENQKLALRAYGYTPDWTISITPKGLLLDQVGSTPKALPYLEEKLPGDRTSFSTEANGQQLELWVAPQRCQEPSGFTHLSATLHLNGQVLRGCAYLGTERAP